MMALTRTRRFGWWGVAACLVGLLAGTPVRAASPVESEGLEFFEKEVKPLLQASCLKCHGGESKIKGNLRLTSRETILKGGDTGPAVSPDAPEKSLLLDAINYRNDLEMPPKQKLSADKIEVLTKWVKMGAPWTPGLDLAPAGSQVAAAPSRPAPPKPEDPAARTFWSFQPVTRPAVPEVKDKAWVRNPIDAFVLAKLEAKGLTPAAPADKVALLRRAYYDLTGLPPTPAEVDAFVADSSPDAYEKVIDRLLDSPHYGEKWGRHWLDVVRYAETNSYERDNPKPNAWRFRDYVIRSFNADKPYDEFVKEQIAGDEMADVATNPDRLIATGFYRLGIWDDEPSDRDQARFDGLDDIVTTVGQGFLGLTVDCARCHDHKIDPIPQADYYRLLAFFRNITDYHNGDPTDQRPITSSQAERDAFETADKERKQQLGVVDRQIHETWDNFFQLLTGDPAFQNAKKDDAPRLIEEHGKSVLGVERFKAYRQLLKQRERLVKPTEAKALALCVSEPGPDAPETTILIRGMAAAKGARVEPGFPRVLNAPEAVIPKPAPGAHTSGRRTVLANWIASKENPLTSRVIANRLWEYHFGRGIVRSPNNFGFQGDKPTHPELLDWLASELVQDGWHFKAMHRLIMTSNAYRMASTGDPKALAADPQNDLFWRFDLRRLTAEEVRDSVLALNGTLNLAMYGPSVYPPIPKEILAGESMPGHGWPTSNAVDSCRRSVYVHVKRSLHLPILESFDGPETDRTCPVRFVTVQPTQALGMLNGSFLNEEAAKLAARLKKEAGDDVRAQVTLAFRLATGRTPPDKDVERGLGLIASLQKHDGATPDAAMRYFCLMVLNLDEFMYVD